MLITDCGEGGEKQRALGRHCSNNPGMRWWRPSPGWRQQRQNKYWMHVQGGAYRIGGFPGGSDGKESAYDGGDLGSIPVSGRCPYRRERQPIPVFLPEKSHGQRNMVGSSPWGSQRVKHYCHVHARRHQDCWSELLEGQSCCSLSGEEMEGQYWMIRSLVLDGELLLQSGILREVQVGDVSLGNSNIEGVCIYLC